MKVKGIMFSGFAAAILMGTVNAYAALEIASKDYVDNKIGGDYSASNTVAAAISALETKTDALPTDENLATINENISALQTTVAGKQNTISDLDDIRSGAAAGATAVQPAAISDMETKTHAAATYQPIGDYLTEHQSLADYATTAAMNTALADKQDTISDLSTIRSGAAAGATAVQPAAISDMETKTHAAATYQPIGDYLTEHQSLADYATTAAMNTALADKQDTISDLSTIRSGAAAGATAQQPATTLAGYGITDAYTKGEVDTKISNVVTNDLGDALSDYAKTADVETALADKQDTISDLSTIRSGAAAGATAQQPATTLAGYGITDAYTKGEVDTALTGKQASLSEAQLAAANSGITAAKVSTYDGYATTIAGKADASDVETALAGKQASLSEAQLAAANSGITADKVSTYDGYATTIAGKADASDVDTALAGKQASLSEAQLAAANSGITAAKVGAYDTHIANNDIHVTAEQKAAWDAKQAALPGYTQCVIDAASGNCVLVADGDGYKWVAVTNPLQ